MSKTKLKLRESILRALAEWWFTGRLGPEIDKIVPFIDESHWDAAKTMRDHPLGYRLLELIPSWEEWMIADCKSNDLVPFLLCGELSPADMYNVRTRIAGLAGERLKRNVTFNRESVSASLKRTRESMKTVKGVQET